MFGQVKILVYITVAVLLCSYGFLQLARRDRLAPMDYRMPAMMAAILIVGYIAPSYWILYVLLLVLPMAIGRTRLDSCCVFIIALLSVPEVPQTLTVAGHYIAPINTTKVLALGLLLAVAARPRPAGPVPGRRFDLPFLLLLGLTVLSQLRGQNATGLIRMLGTEVLGMAVPYYVLSRTIRGRADVNRLLLAIVFGAVVLSLMSIYEAVRSWPIYLNINYRFGFVPGVSQSLKVRAGLMRTATTFVESTSYSLFLAMALVAAMTQRPVFRTRARYAAAIGAILIGLLLAQARGGWVAAAIGVVAFDFYLRRYSRLGTQVVVGGLAVLMLLFAAQGSVRVAEALGMSGTAVGSKDYRVQLFYRGLDEIRKHPFVGNDMGEVTAHLADLRQGEQIVDFVNGYIFFGVTTGIPGVVAFFVMFASLAVRMVMNRRRPLPGEPPDGASAWVFAVAMLFMVSAATTGFGSRPVAFLIVAMAIGSVHRGIARRPLAQDAAIVPQPDRRPGMPSAQPA